MTTPLARFGGKGANLITLRDAGLPVPEFVVIPTEEYAEFVATSGLAGEIESALGHPDRADPDRDETSEHLRAAFRAASPTTTQRARLLTQLGHLTTTPVAVRSSATAEDLPGLSFAGQQDSFLDVTGPDAILEAIVDCWSSIWTARAISYRDRNAIDHLDVSIAVVIQRMIPAEASGVLFTANPQTGRRNETVIESVRGLGDALVSGLIEPDSHTLDTPSGRLIDHHLTADGPRLSPAELDALRTLGQKVQALQQSPQDIEWAIADGRVHLLQARAITSLYPIPDPHEPNDVWFSFGAFQGMLAPITPLGQDVLRMMIAGAASLGGVRGDWRAGRTLVPAGERLWVRTTPILQTAIGRRVLTVVPSLDPGIAAIMTRLADEPAFGVRRRLPQPTSARGLARFLGTIAPGVPRTLADPEGTRARLDAAAEETVASVRRDLAPNHAADADPQARLTARASGIEQHAQALLAGLLPAFGPIMAPSILMLRQLQRIAATTDLPDAAQLPLVILRSLPGNVTTGMDLTLADLAAQLRADPALRDLLTSADPNTLATRFLAGDLPPRAQQTVAGFLDTYGMRVVAEIDLGAPRWRDDPTPVFQTLGGYIAADDQPHPRALHAAGAVAADAAIEQLAGAVGPLEARRIRLLARTLRGVFGARETPKFTIIRCFGIFREALAASAADLVAAGRLHNPDDIYFLHFDELQLAFTHDFRDEIAERRTTHAAEARRPRIPRVLVGDGRALHEGLGADGDLIGAGVSPGVAEGPARIVFDPRHARLDPGDILVCPGTDPAWTPLFLTAGGLITEVGGMMTHGSVVARECGIPAVVGVDAATTRLTDGQRIRIDGTSGAIALL
ncbi:PEP/pyruvate-binding domain-containing protein [Ammonicoccus fulvus]|uniref:PEP/pyruvate-binding domain-containing protein n=1 Tax=Ammonicoccus fulvus TaxID=3138240 RepID=A0ABZ3FMB1_9ACTN